MVSVQHGSDALDSLTVPRLLQCNVKRQGWHRQPQPIQLLRLACNLRTTPAASTPCRSRAPSRSVG